MEANSPRRRRTSLLVLAGALGALFGLGCVLLYWVLTFREPLPQLSPQDFEAAQRRWRETGPRDYDFEVEVVGRQPAVYRVEVRGGEPVAALRNGQPLPQRRTWVTWTVPGTFDTLSSDFRNLALAAAGQADETTPRLALFGVFDSEFGYPARYRRVMLGQGREESMAHRIGSSSHSQGGDAAAAEVSWTVREFTVCAAK